MPRPPLVLLHGSNGCADEMWPLVRKLREYDLRVPNLLGHGGRPVPDRLDVDLMVADLEAWLDAEGIGPAHFLGYSFGGYLGLALALRHADRVRSLTAMAVIYRWGAEAVRHVVHLADPERLGRPGNPRREQMEAAHGADKWPKVTENNRALFASFAEGGAPLNDAQVSTIGTPVLVLSGEKDPLAPAAEARYLAEVLPNARVGLWPGAAHPLSAVPLIEVKYALRDFVREVEEGRFSPGPELRLKPQLVPGGLSFPQVEATVRRPGESR
ncbi:MAG: alpha/beta hydrolase [Pseudomonadota bacterium]|nr:alpha/beta hydrolase [Pseudomonadota bacterium]